MISLSYAPFQEFILKKTSKQSQERYLDSLILDIQVYTNKIKATIYGTRRYEIQIQFDEEKVTQAICSCPYDKSGACKHIIHAIVEADRLLQIGAVTLEDTTKNTVNKTPPKDFSMNKTDDGFILQKSTVLGLEMNHLKTISNVPKSRGYWNDDIYVDIGKMEANIFTAKLQNYRAKDPANVSVEQKENEVHLKCDCLNVTNKLCNHLFFLLREILTKDLFQLSFDSTNRIKKLREKAQRLGLNEIEDLDAIFYFSVEFRRITIESRVSIFPLGDNHKKELQKKLLTEFHFPTAFQKIDKKEIIVLQKNSFSEKLEITLMHAPLTKAGEIKSPIEEIDLSKEIHKEKDTTKLALLTAINYLSGAAYKTDIDTSIYLDIFKNTHQLPFYFFKNEDASKVTPKNISLIEPKITNPQATIYVDEKQEFYSLTCSVHLENKTYLSKSIKLIDKFHISKDKIYFLNNEHVRKVIAFFAENKHQIYLHKTQFKEFKELFLDELENYVSIVYSFVKHPEKKNKSTKTNLLQNKLEHLICLSESEDYILITPVMSYEEVEVPILSKKNIYKENPDGSLTPLERDEKAEIRFLRNIQSQHNFFEEYPSTTFFYLHKQEFLENGWFVNAFENWRDAGYTILGFNQLKNNTYNANKMKVTTKVNSGIDWFDVSTSISFGNQKATLKDIQKSIINKSRYVKLGDGTHGILPQEWLEKFGHYFRTGEVKEDIIRTHKSNFHVIDELFDKEVLSEEVKIELEQYREKLANFHSIRNIHVPQKLKATLRDYQKEGLNWLNFLDEFNFGGCLADDMGLGKTVQIIAYFLSQQEKGNKGTNLVVVPTSLLFNWQKEIEKFAPHLKFIALYGTNRTINVKELKKQDVVITTYGTLLSDIEQLKEIFFNVIVLDESQAIKNIESKRYKAVRLLQGRQRLVVTGTPVENNTFDLYAQLSFAAPGLLGNAKRFATDYSTPIDKFQDIQRAKELQQKVHPFILRRTKKQVATELPEKTEMVVYCEMDKEQRRVYDSYREEFKKYLSGLSDDELHSSNLHVLQGLTKLRQICNSPALLSDEEFYGNESAKLETLLNYINDLKENHKLIIFSQFVGMLDLIKTELNNQNIPFTYLTGQTRNREEQVDLFQNDETIRVFLISLKAGGTGLNLTKAEYVFLVDPWWNPAVENQAIDRAYRIGQENKVVAIRLITPDTIEEKIIELQQRKKQLVEDLIHTDTNVLKNLSKEDLMKLV